MPFAKVSFLPQTSLLGPLLFQSSSDHVPHHRVFTSIGQLSQQDAVMDNLHQETRLLIDQRGDLMRMMENFKEEDVDENSIPGLENDLDKIRNAKNEYQNEVEDFIERYIDLVDDPKELENWQAEVSNIGKVVKRYVNTIRNRKEELFPTPQPVSFERRSLELQERTVKLHKQLLEEEQKEAELSPNQFSVHDQNSLDLHVMALKLHQHTLEERQEAFTAKQQGRNSNLPTTDANLLLAECNKLCDRILKDADTIDTRLAKEGAAVTAQTELSFSEHAKISHCLAGADMFRPGLGLAVAVPALTNSVVKDLAMADLTVTGPAWTAQSVSYVTEPAETEPIVTEPAMTELDVIIYVGADHSVTDPEMTNIAVTGHPLQEHTVAGHGVNDHADQAGEDHDVEDHAVVGQTVENYDVKVTVNNGSSHDLSVMDPCMQEMKAKNPSMKEAVRKEIVKENPSEIKRTAKVKLMWNSFLVKQLLIYLVKQMFSGSKWTPIVHDSRFSKCLNDANRALFLKLEAATLLATADQDCVWFAILKATLTCLELRHAVLLSFFLRAVLVGLKLYLGGVCLPFGEASILAWLQQQACG